MTGGRLSLALALGASLSILLTGCGPWDAGSASQAGSVLPGATAVSEPSVCTGYKTYDGPGPTPLRRGRTYRAVVTTNRGVFTITLDPQLAPLATQSFIFLARHHYFDGVSFHRVVPGFVIQGGDPTGTGSCGPGYAFKDEKVTQSYVRGTVAMANAGPNTNGSQFFIVLQDHTPLNSMPNYTIFGHVSAGMATVDNIARVPLGASAGGEISHPLNRVYMKSVRLTTG